MTTQTVAEPAAELAPAVAPAPRRRLPQLSLPDVRRLRRTTPGILTLLAVVLAVGAFAFAFAGSVSERSRAGAAEAVHTQSEPLLLDAVRLYGTLSVANATATSTFLTGGLEPAARRARYLNDIHTASASLTAVTRLAGGSPAVARALSAIAAALPSYTGLVETARADNRQVLPVGAAYMRAASSLLTGTILPAAGSLYRTGAQRLDGNYATGTATATLAALVVELVLILALFAFVLWRLALATHRILNLPALAGALLMLALAIWAVLALIGEQGSLADAQRTGSDQVEVAAAARIMLSRAQTDDSLTLIERGGDKVHPADWSKAMAALGMRGGGVAGGLIGELRTLAARTGSQRAVAAIASDLSRYAAQHARIDGLMAAGQVPQAISLGVTADSAQTSPADRSDAALAAQIAAAQRRFQRSAADAAGALGGLSLAIPLLTVVAAVLALAGLAERIEEYR